MSIRIKEAVLIHEAVIFRFLEDGASASQCSLNGSFTVKPRPV